MKVLGMAAAAALIGALGPANGERTGTWIPEGTVAEIDGCTVEVEGSCEGEAGRLVHMTVDCAGSNPYGLGMGLNVGDCFALNNAAYCVDSIELEQGASFVKRYDTKHTGLTPGDVLWSAEISRQ